MPVSACDVVAASAHTSDGEDDSKSMRQGGLECTPCEDCALSGPRHRMRTMRRRRFDRPRPRPRLPPSHDALRILRAANATQGSQLLSPRPCSQEFRRHGYGGTVAQESLLWTWFSGDRHQTISCSNDTAAASTEVKLLQLSCVDISYGYRLSNTCQILANATGDNHGRCRRRPRPYLLIFKSQSLVPRLRRSSEEPRHRATGAIVEEPDLRGKLGAEY